MIYKIFRPNEYEDFQNKGESQGSPDDLRDGFVHFSTQEQLRATFEKYFHDEPVLYILACDPQQFSQLKWEPSRGGALFPHLYEMLTLEHIAQTWRIIDQNIPVELLDDERSENNHLAQAQNAEN